MPTAYPDKLFAAMTGKIRQRIEAHNARFPQPAYRRSYPARIKVGDENCLFNICRAWASQTAADIRAGRPVTNRVHINNRDSQNGRRDKSNVGRYLSKFGLAGFIGARQATELDPARYRCQFQQGGRGFGFVPIKRNHGTLADYELLLDPALLPLQAIPTGTPIFLLDALGPKGHNPTKVESFQVPLDYKEFINEGMSQAERLTPPHAATTEERQAQPAKPDLLDGQDNPEDKKEKAAPPIPYAQVQDAWRTFRLLMEQGEIITAHAVLLVSQFLEKLAPAMGKSAADYLPSTVERGVSQAIRLLASYEDPSQAFDVFSLTIDRLQAAIHQNPSTYAAPPGKWFDPDYPFNIEKAYEKYYLPWEETRLRLADQAKRRQLADQHTQEGEKQLANRSQFHALAWSIKTHLMRHHAQDLRLRRANLESWAHTLRLLIEQDQVPYPRACEVAKWWLCSEHRQAIFFRQEMGKAEKPLGIRSASGFRRHYRAIETAFAAAHAEQVRQAS